VKKKSILLHSLWHCEHSAGFGKKTARHAPQRERQKLLLQEREKQQEEAGSGRTTAQQHNKQARESKRALQQ